MKAFKIVRPDAKGRVGLGILSKDISGFKLTTDKHGRFILEPLNEIPARERWLYKNPEALASLRQGLKELAEGKFVKLDPSRFLDEDEK